MDENYGRAKVAQKRFIKLQLTHSRVGWLV